MLNHKNKNQKKKEDQNFEEYKSESEVIYL